MCCCRRSSHADGYVGAQAALRADGGVSGSTLEMDAMTNDDHAPMRRTYSWAFVEAEIRRHERREQLLLRALWACLGLLLLAAAVLLLEVL